MVFKLLQENSDVILKEDGDALLLELLGLLPESVSGSFQFGGVNFSTQVDLPVASATGTFSLGAVDFSTRVDLDVDSLSESFSLGGVDFTTRADLDVSSLVESFTFGDTTVKLTFPMNVDSLVEGFDIGDVDFTTQVDLGTDSLVEGFSFGGLAFSTQVDLPVDGFAVPAVFGNIAAELNLNLSGLAEGFDFGEPTFHSRVDLPVDGVSESFTIGGPTLHGFYPLRVDALDARAKFGQLAFKRNILPSSVTAAFRIGGVYDLEEYFFFSNPRGRGVPRLSYPLPDPPSIHLWRRVLSEFRGQNLWIDHDGVVHGGYPDDLADAAYIFLSARTHRVSPEVAEILTEAGFTTEPEYVGS